MHPQLSRTSPGVHKWPRKDFGSKQEPEICGNWMAFCYTKPQKVRVLTSTKGHLRWLNTLNSDEHFEFILLTWNSGSSIVVRQGTRNVFSWSWPWNKDIMRIYPFLKENSLWNTSLGLEKSLHCFLSFSTKITSQNLQMQNSLLEHNFLVIGWSGQFRAKGRLPKKMFRLKIKKWGQRNCVCSWSSACRILSFQWVAMW